MCTFRRFLFIIQRNIAKFSESFTIKIEDSYTHFRIESYQ